MKRFYALLAALLMAAPLVSLHSAEMTQNETAVAVVSSPDCSDVKSSSARSDQFDCNAGADVIEAAARQAYNRALRKAQDECIKTTDECFVEVLERQATIVQLDNGNCVVIVGIRWQCCCFG